jgi:Zn finger protein HypA/HybF involved in hydrogenase expression
MEDRPGPTKRKTTETFIQQAKIVHGDLYDYSQIVYTGGHDTVIIICKEHGPFVQQAQVHLTGCGCPTCGGGFRWDKNTFISESVKIHENKYDYSNFEYVNFKTQSTIICPKHGAFQQDPDHHIMGHGCPSCGKSKSVSDEEIELFRIG